MAGGLPTRRYQIPPRSARTIAALFTRRDQLIDPSSPVSPPVPPTNSRVRTALGQHYQALRLEIMALFAELGIACGQTTICR